MTDKQQKKEQNNSRRVAMKNEFYEDHLSRYVILVVMCALILFFLIYSVFITFWEEPKDKYFAGHNDGSIIKNIPLNKRFFFDSEVTSWASTSIMQLMSFDFLNYAENISQQSRHFTNDGLNSFINWFKNQLLTDIQKNRYVLSTHLCGIAEVYNRGLDKNNIFTWDVNIPLVIVLQNSDKKKLLSTVVKVNLVRVPNTDSFEGVNINNVSFNNLVLATTSQGQKNCPTSPKYTY